MASLKDRVGRKAQSERETDPSTFINGGTNGKAIEYPWDGLDKKAVPRTVFNLRLNDYELAILRWLADQREESMQKIAKRILIPELEGLAENQRKLS